MSSETRSKRPRSTRWTVCAFQYLLARNLPNSFTEELELWNSTTWFVRAVMFSSSVVWWFHDLMIAWYVANVLVLHIFRIVCCIFTAQQRCATWTHFIDDDTVWLHYMIANVLRLHIFHVTLLKWTARRECATCSTFYSRYVCKL